MRALKVIVSCIALSTVAGSAMAQNDPPPRRERPAGERPAGEGPGRGAGPRAALSPEKAKAAWQLEAAGVAKRLGLTEDQTKAVVKAYAEARESHNKAAEKMREEMMATLQDGGDGDREAMRERAQKMQKAMEDMNKAEREKLEKSLASTLSADQASKASASLGTFNRQWDTMVDTIAGFQLPADKQQPALEAIEDYVVAQSKARPAGPDGDREAVRTAMQEARTKLNDSLKKVLSEEQAKKFEEATRGRGGAGGPGGPGGGGGRGRNRDNGGGG